MPGGLRVDIHLTAADTNGAMTVLVDHPRAGWSLPTHRHAHEAETVHVLAGEFVSIVGDVRCMVGPGDTVHVAAGVPHSGALIGPAPGLRIVQFAPGGMDGFFVEAGTEDPSDAPDLSRVLDAAVRHGWQFGT